MAKSGILDPGKIGFFDQQTFSPKNVSDIFPGHAVPLFFRAKIFRAVPCQDFSVPRFSVPGRAINLRVLRAVPCQSVPVISRKNNKMHCLGLYQANFSMGRKHAKIG